MTQKYPAIMKMTTIQIRIDEKTKREVMKVLDKLGLDLTTAITMFLRQIVIHQGMPFIKLSLKEIEAMKKKNKR